MTKSAPYSEIGDRSQVRLAVVYSRVAAQGPTALKASFDDAELHCRRWAWDNSCHIVEYIRDNAGPLTTNPPGLQRLRELLNERNVDVVLAYSPDRISMGQDQLQELLAELDQAGASLEFVVDHPISIRRNRQR